MLHRVAERLGYRDVDAMVDEIPKVKLTKWLAVSRLDGWGDGWYMVAAICAAIHNGFLLIIARFLGGVDEKDFVDLMGCFPEHMRSGTDNTKSLVDKFIVNEPGHLEDWMKRMAGIK